jgi:hypothetical protein
MRPLVLNVIPPANANRRSWRSLLSLRQTGVVGLKRQATALSSTDGSLPACPDRASSLRLFAVLADNVGLLRGLARRGEKMFCAMAYEGF